MNFLEIILEVLSPTIITERRTLRGFLKVPNFIPASTLRGAILSELYRRGVIEEDFLKGERTKPSVIASYAHPVTSRGEKSYPSHPFMWECKTCEERINYLSEVIDDLENYNNLRERTHITCRKGHVTLETLYSKYYPIDDGRERKVSTSRFVCTSVSKTRGSSEVGMLYEYEAIAPGRRFWAILSIPDELVKYIDGLEIRIGRGISRGFGISKIIELSMISLREVLMRIEDSIIRRDYVVFYSPSPLISCHEDYYSPYPMEIDSSRIAVPINAKGRLKIKAVYGKSDFQIGGWDVYENVEKPTIKFATRPGAIVTAEFTGDIQFLAALSLSGTIERLGNTVITGVNMLHPIRSHPLFKVT
ncbi:MAG: RAMP superfamily CRISPR-associated protein [Candidatus Nezhaarchaeales archaeon]